MNISLQAYFYLTVFLLIALVTTLFLLAYVTVRYVREKQTLWKKKKKSFGGGTI